MRILCGTCGTGETSTGAQYEDEPGGCCAPKTPCLQTCAAGEERTTVQYQEDGACCQPMACVEEIGPWTEVDVWAAMPSDTCNNDSNYDYDCRYYQGSEVKSCVDVQIYGYPSAEYKDLPPAEFVYDHCDGDMVNKYFCPGSSNVHCLDVYGTPQYARLTPRTWTGRCDTGHSGQGNFGAAPGEICVFRYSGGVLSMGGLERYCKGINGAAPEGEYLDNGCFMPTQSCQGSQFTSGTTQGYSVYCIQNPIYTQREVSCSKAPARQRRMKCCPGK